MSLKYNSLILPTKTPIITSYYIYSITFSILQNHKNTEPWYYTNFINIWGDDLGEFGLPVRFSSWDFWKVCPFLLMNELSFDLANSFSNTIVDFLKHALLNDYYVLLPYDEYYVKHSDYYKKVHSQHAMLVYGFDENNRMFYVADFFKKKIYSFEKLSFDIIETTTKHVINIQPPDFWLSIDRWNNLMLLKFINVEYEFDINLLKKNIYDYLNSKRTVISYEDNIVNDDERLKIQNDDLIFGLNNYNLLKDYLLKIKNNKKRNVDVRPLHVLYDHKVLMMKRLNFLRKNGLLVNYNNLHARLKKRKKVCLVNRNMLLKYLVTLNVNIIDRINNKINFLMQEEKKFLIELLNSIRS